MMVFVLADAPPLDGSVDVHDTAFMFDISNNEFRIEHDCA